MKLDVKKLNEAGVSVTIKDNGRTVEDLRNATVEVYIVGGLPPTEITELVRDAVKTDVYRNVLIDNIVMSVQKFQILEAIERTGE